MSQKSNFLVNIRRIIKLHETMLKQICQDYHLSLIGKDTAADIVELRMLSKGNVSQAVESLIQKSILQRKQDTEDRRKIHLSLTPAAHPITQELEIISKEFLEEVFSGLSQEELELLERMNDRIIENTKNAIARREKL